MLHMLLLLEAQPCPFRQHSPFESMVEHPMAQCTWQRMHVRMAAADVHVQLVPALSHEVPFWQLHCIVCLHAAVLLYMCICVLPSAYHSHRLHGRGLDKPACLLAAAMRFLSTFLVSSPLLQLQACQCLPGRYNSPTLHIVPGKGVSIQILKGSEELPA